MCPLRDPIPAVVISPLLPEPPVTGGQKRTLRLLEAMARAGLDPRILTTDTGEPGAAEQLRMRGWAVEIVPEHERTQLDRLRQHAQRLPSPFLPEIATRLKTLATDAALVQYEHTQSAYYAVPPGVSTVLSLHNVDSAAARSAASGRRGVSWLREHTRAAELRAVERRVIPHADRVLCVSEDDAAAVTRAGGHALLAPNGVDEEFFSVNCPGDEDRVLFFGHFGYEANRRGIERFLAEGWPEVLRARPQARLALAGGGLDGSLPRVDGVDVLGRVADLAAVVGAARAVVVPIWEGGGTRLKVLEALAAARAVVSTPLGASGVGFEHGRHGLLAESPIALGGALVRVLADPGQASTLGREGRILAERFRWKEALSAASAFYSEVMGRARFAV
jgi:glycosyltransferase involved in cell wall biosynthesis